MIKRRTENYAAAMPFTKHEASKRISVELPPDVLEPIDMLRDRKGKDGILESRSDFIVKALRIVLNSEDYGMCFRPKGMALAPNETGGSDE